jgi:hypothetical protein
VAVTTPVDSFARMESPPCNRARRMRTNYALTV